MTLQPYCARRLSAPDGFAAQQEWDRSAYVIDEGIDLVACLRIIFAPIISFGRFAESTIDTGE